MMRIEIPIILVTFAWALSGAVITNWLMYRVCYTVLSFNKSECNLLMSKNSNNVTETMVEIVQPYVTVITTTIDIVQALGSATMCFFIGPWSDKYGRKPVFLLCFGSYTLAHLILTLISIAGNLSPWFILFFIIPLCFCGGIMTIFEVVFSYAADTSLPIERGLKLAILHVVIESGRLVGTISASFMLETLGYALLYTISTFCIFLALILIFFFIPESVRCVQTKERFRNLFQFSLVKLTLTATFIKRDNDGRRLLLFLITILFLYLLAEPQDSFVYLFLQNKFEWNLEKFNIFNSINIIIKSVGSAVGIYYLHNLLQVKESILIAAGFLSLLCKALSLGLINSYSQIYLVLASGFLSGIVRPLLTTFISKIILLEEIGKIFAFIAIIDTIAIPVNSILYTSIYNSTLSTFPEAFNFFSAGIGLLELILSMMLIKLQANQSQIVYQRSD